MMTGAARGRYAYASSTAPLPGEAAMRALLPVATVLPALLGAFRRQPPTRARGVLCVSLLRPHLFGATCAAFLLAADPAVAAWPPNGRALCESPTARGVLIAPDGSGGAF